MKEGTLEGRKVHIHAFADEVAQRKLMLAAPLSAYVKTY